MPKFIQLDGRPILLHINKDSIHAISLNHEVQNFNKYSVTVNGKNICNREEFDTYEEAEKRYIELLSELND